MDACAKVKRCKEEAVFLREEARDALIYYQRQEHNLASAVRAREDSEDPVARSHKLLLERELSKVQRLKARMLQTQAYLNTLFGELPGAHQEGAAMEGDVPESAPTGEADLGADPEVFPESQDADYEGTDYDDDEEAEEEEEGGEEGDEEEDLAPEEGDSGYTSVRGGDLLGGDVRLWL